MQNLTIEALKEMPPQTIFASGHVELERQAYYLKYDEFIFDKKMRINWIAKTGNIEDWCIYASETFTDREAIAKHGAKIITEEFIRHLVPCSDEAFVQYRY